MSSVMIIGDPHIGKNTNLGKVGIGATLNSRIVDQVHILNWALDQAMERYISHIIVTGDVFEEPRPHPSLISLLIEWLKKCEVNGIHVHIIMGNHDVFRTGNFYTSPLDIISSCELTNVTVYNQISTVYVDSTAFTLIPFRDRKSLNADTNAEALSILESLLDYEEASIPMVFKKVVVGHLALEGSIPVGDEIDDIANELMCPVNMFHKYDYGWFGHVHKPQVLQKSPYMAHIGSMDISNFGESDQAKKIVIFDANVGGHPSVPDFTYITIPTRPLRKISISIPKDTHNTTQFVINELMQMSKDLNKAIVRLEIHLTSPELLSVDRSEIDRTLSQIGVHSVVNISESKKLVPIKKENQQQLDMSIDVSSAIKTWSDNFIEKDKREPFIKLAFKTYEQYRESLK